MGLIHGFFLLMTNSDVAFDLLGDPIPQGFGRRGRPPHVPTQQNRNKIMLLLAQGWTNARIAHALGITQPTLTKHYFRELRARDAARDRVEAIGLLSLWQQGRAGNVGAMKEYFRRHDAAIAPLFEDKVEKAAERLGKKERLRQEADNPPAGWETVTARVAH